MTKFFMFQTDDKELEEELWKDFNKKSNPQNQDKFKKRVYSISQLNSKFELVHKDTVGGNFPGSKIPLCAIIETDSTFDLYGIKLTDTNGVLEGKHYLHQVHKSPRVLVQYFD